MLEVREDVGAVLALLAEGVAHEVDRLQLRERPQVHDAVQVAHEVVAEAEQLQLGERVHAADVRDAVAEEREVGEAGQVLQS